jgi:hypothetical protein
MSDEAAQPEEKLAQAIRNAIMVGAAEGAEAAARRIATAASTGLDEVRTVLQTLAAGAAPQPVTVTGSASLSSMAIAGRVHTAAAALTVPVTMGSVSSAGAALTGLVVPVTMGGVGTADVAAAADELGTIRQSDVEKLADQLPVRWTKQELVLNSLFLVAVVYWLLPSVEQQYLAGMAGLVQAVVAVAALLKKP